MAGSRASWRVWPWSLLPVLYLLCSLTWPVAVGEQTSDTQVTLCAQFCRPPPLEQPTEEPLHQSPAPWSYPCISSLTLLPILFILLALMAACHCCEPCSP